MLTKVIKSILDRFKANGLNAIEDPAQLNTKQWIALQKIWWVI